MIHCKRHLCYVIDDTDVLPYYKLHVVFMPSHYAQFDVHVTKPSIKLKEHIKWEHFQPKKSVASIINLNLISSPLHVFQEVQCVDQIPSLPAFFNVAYPVSKNLPVYGMFPQIKPSFFWI